MHCPPFELHTVIEPLAANHQDRSTFKVERREQNQSRLLEVGN
jgi:hypothetical protein